MNNGHRVRLIDGHVVRDAGSSSPPSFSFRRFILLLLLGSLLVVTNPANEMKDTVTRFIDGAMDFVTGSGMDKRRSDMSEWAWQKVLDPPLSVTNYGIFSVEDRNTRVVFFGLGTQSWSCSYYDESMGRICNALARNMCHGGPLLYNAKNYAYTAHRCICFLLMAVALLSFCYGGHLPASITKEPVLRVLLTCLCRSHFSVASLGLDLFNASMFVYPALVRVEEVVPTLQEGAFALNLGLPSHYDFIFYAIVLVLFLGGGSNVFTNFFFSKDPCFGFDSTVAAAVAYCHAVPNLSFAFGAEGGLVVSPQTVFWASLPVTALLGGSPSHAVSWLMAGMFGYALGQYHADHRNWFLAFQQVAKSLF